MGPRLTTIPSHSYNSFLSVGVAFGLFISGFITADLGWRYIYWVCGSVIGGLTLFVIFNFPETTFQRPALRQVVEGDARNIDYSTQHSYPRRLNFFSGIHTQESMLQLFIRPFITIAYPAVLWATLVCAGTIGFLVAVTTNVAIAYGKGYGFGPSQVGLCFLAGIIGSAAGIVVGGSFPDWLSKRLAKRNGGIREPEMRLWAIAPTLISAPLALALFGAGIQHQWHWIVPTIGLGLINFSIVSGTNVAIVYAVDVYKPIANEALTAILAYKAAIGFLLSFYTNEWVARQGYQNAYGEMAAISAGLILFFLPLYYFGKRIRVSSLNWRATQYIKWHADRDDAIFEEDE
jgi:MFS family permease